MEREFDKFKQPVASYTFKAPECCVECPLGFCDKFNTITKDDEYGYCIGLAGAFWSIGFEQAKIVNSTQGRLPHCPLVICEQYENIVAQTPFSIDEDENKITRVKDGKQVEIKRMLSTCADCGRKWFAKDYDDNPRNPDGNVDICSDCWKTKNPPDVDIDLNPQNKEKTIEYVNKKYGND